jgi:hypothetical protein
LQAAAVRLDAVVVAVLVAIERQLLELRAGATALLKRSYRFHQDKCSL